VPALMLAMTVVVILLFLMIRFFEGF